VLHLAVIVTTNALSIQFNSVYFVKPILTNYKFVLYTPVPEPHIGSVVTLEWERVRTGLDFGPSLLDQTCSDVAAGCLWLNASVERRQMLEMGRRI